MKNSQLSTLDLIHMKLNAKSKYLSTLDKNMLKAYNDVNESLYGYSVFANIPQSLLERIKEQTQQYAEDFDKMLIDSLTTNLNFSSLQ